MVNLVIISTGNDYRKIIIFCEFFRINYSIIQETRDLKLIDECTIYITSDLSPDIYLFEYIFNQESVMSEIKFKNTCSKWVASFCAVLFKSISLNSIPDEITMVDNLTSNNPEIPIPYPCSLRKRCSVFNEIYKKFYYKDKGQDPMISKYIVHLYIEVYQQLYLQNDISVHLEETRHQTRVGSSVNRKYIGSRSLEYVKNGIKNSKISLNDCYSNQLIGYEVDIDISPDKLINCALGISGIYRINPIGDELSLNRDITLIGFYYDFNIVGRSPKAYIDAVKLWSRLKYPIAFYGTQNTIEIFKESRLGLENYTEARELIDWPDLEKYKEHLPPRPDRFYYDQNIYRIGTSIKLWALENTIAKNPFTNNIYIWFDPGFYKNDKLVCPELMENTRIFDNIEIPKDKIIITSYVTNPGLTDEELRKNIDKILSWLLIGYKETWLKFIPIYRKLYYEMNEPNRFFTEQMLLGKMYHNYPELFDVREYGLHFSYLPKILNLK